MKKSSFYSTLLLAALAWFAPLALHAEPALVGHKGLASQTLDADAVKAVLLGKKITLGDTRVVIVIVKTSEDQDKFLQGSIGMNTGQFQTHWRRLYMTGGGTAPKIVETEADAVKLVAETPGAVAAIDKAKAGDLAVLSSK